MGILKTNIERNHFVDRHPWTPYWSDCFQTHYEPYLELSQGRPNLVICYGDSWTWGDSLVKNITGSTVDQPYIRLDNVHGRKLADLTNSDFVNCAIPGIYNYWILDRLQILIDHDIDRLCKRYQKIYIVVTLTEIGRDFDFKNYCTDFENFFTVDSKTLPEELCKACERFDFFHLDKIEKQLPDNVTMLVGRNFTHVHPDNKQLMKCLLAKSWSDLLFQKQNFNFDQNVIIMSHGIDRFDNYVRSKKIDNQHYKQWLSDVIYPIAKKQIDLLRRSKYNYKIATKHPTPKGHEIWANYVFSQLP
jgi:hypothetical protein